MSGNIIRALREQRGWAQGRLAQAAGLPQSYLSNIEQGKRRGSVEALQAIAKALGVGLDELLAAPADPLAEPPIEELRASGVDATTLAALAARWPAYSLDKRRAYWAQARDIQERIRQIEASLHQGNAPGDAPVR